MRVGKKLHRKSLRKTRILVRRTVLLAGILLFGAAYGMASLAFAQEKPDRPPWAQPAGTAPAQPIPPEASVQAPPPQEKKEPASPRNAIKVNVNLVNVLVSVLDDKNRPAPDLTIEAFQVFEEGVQQKIDI